LQRVCRRINVEIVKRSDLGKFVVLPRRWVVERSIAWLNRCRRLAKDWECLNRNALAFLRWASVRLNGQKAMSGNKMTPDRWGDWGLSPGIPVAAPLRMVERGLVWVGHKH
jgi:hypothetical protein